MPASESSRPARRAPSALLATGRRSAFGRCMAQPGMALRERLRVRANRGDAVEPIDLPQQVVAHVEAGLADDRERCRQEQVERARDDAFARILDRHDAEVGGAGAGRVEHLVGARAGQADDRRAEVAERGELAERARRAEVGDARRRLQRAACRHDLAPDRRDALDRQRARIGLLQRVDDRRLALGSERGRALGALERADRRCDARRDG